MLLHVAAVSAQTQTHPMLTCRQRNPSHAKGIRGFGLHRLAIYGG